MLHEATEISDGAVIEPPARFIHLCKVISLEVLNVMLNADFCHLGSKGNTPVGQDLLAQKLVYFHPFQVTFDVFIQRVQNKSYFEEIPVHLVM